MMENKPMRLLSVYAMHDDEGKHITDGEGNHVASEKGVNIFIRRIGQSENITGVHIKGLKEGKISIKEYEEFVDHQINLLDIVRRMETIRKDHLLLTYLKELNDGK